LLGDLVGVTEVQRQSKRPMPRRSRRCWAPRGEPHGDPDAVRRDVVQVREARRMRRGVGGTARGGRASVPLDPAGRQRRPPRRADPLAAVTRIASTLNTTSSHTSDDTFQVPLSPKLATELPSCPAIDKASGQRSARSRGPREAGNPTRCADSRRRRRWHRPPAGGTRLSTVPTAPA
jgi:hypothetical protein